MSGYKSVYGKMVDYLDQGYLCRLYKDSAIKYFKQNGDYWRQAIISLKKVAPGTLHTSLSQDRYIYVAKPTAVKELEFFWTVDPGYKYTGKLD